MAWPKRINERGAEKTAGRGLGTCMVVFQKQTWVCSPAHGKASLPTLGGGEGKGQGLLQDTKEGVQTGAFSRPSMRGDDTRDTDGGGEGGAVGF